MLRNIARAVFQIIFHRLTSGADPSAAVVSLSATDSSLVLDGFCPGDGGVDVESAISVGVRLNALSDLGHRNKIPRGIDGNQWRRCGMRTNAGRVEQRDKLQAVDTNRRRQRDAHLEEGFETTFLREGKG